MPQRQVCGLHDEALQRCLLVKRQPTFQNVQKEALALEAAFLSTREVWLVRRPPYSQIHLTGNADVQVVDIHKLQHDSSSCMLWEN